MRGFLKNIGGAKICAASIANPFMKTEFSTPGLPGMFSVGSEGPQKRARCLQVSPQSAKRCK